MSFPGELCDILFPVDGRSVEESSKNSIVSCDDVHKALLRVRTDISLKEEQLRAFTGNHESEFKEYQARLSEIETTWKPLEADSVMRILNGNENLVAIKVLDSSIKVYDNILTGNWGPETRVSTPSSYLGYLERRLMAQALDLARKPSYDKCKDSVKVALGGGFGTVEFVISQKTAELVAILRETSNLVRGEIAARDVARTLGDIVLIYLRGFEHAFAVQLNQIPHLAALLYNDCQFLSIILPHELLVGERDEEGIRTAEIRAIGTNALLSLLTKQLVEIEEYCSPKRFSARFGQADRDLVESIKRSLAQAAARVSQLVRVLSSILDPDLMTELAELLASPILNWLWSGILSIGSLKQDTVAKLAEVAEQAVSFASTIIPSSELHQYPLLPQIARKFDSLIRMTSMNLLQLSNAFRRSDFIDVISLEEFRAIISFMFPETAMKKAFLAEIDAEM